MEIKKQIFLGKIILLFLLLSGLCQSTYAQDNTQDSVLYRKFLRLGIRGVTIDEIQKMNFDTIIEFRAPKKNYWVYKNESGKVSNFSFNDAEHEWEYDNEGGLIRERVKKKHENHLRYYDGSGTLLKKKYNNGNVEIIEEYKADTVFTQYRNPRGEIYHEFVKQGDSILFKNRIERKLQVNIPDWCGFPLNYIAYNNNSFTRIQLLDSINYKLFTETEYFNGTVKYERHFRNCEAKQDSAVTITLDGNNDTLIWMMSTKKVSPYFLSFVHDSKMIVYHPNDSLQYKKEVFVYDEKEGYIIGKNVYDYKGNLVTIEHHEYGGSCGMPTIRYEHIQDKRKNLTTYYQAKSKPSVKLLLHPKFTYEDYYLLNDYYRNKINYQSQNTSFSAEESDSLVFKNKTISVKEWQDAFLIYLLDNKVRKNKNKRHYRISFSFDRGWSIKNYSKSKEDRFTTAFRNFIKSFDLIGFKLKQKRGIYLSGGGKRVFMKYPIKGFRWECKW